MTMNENTDQMGETPAWAKWLLWVGIIGSALTLFYIVLDDPVAVSEAIAGFVVAAIVVAVVVAVYFAPSIIAHCRGHHNVWAILMLNFFAGWTVIAWMVALVWAFTKVDRQ
jgi:hypothetical protein